MGYPRLLTVLVALSSLLLACSSDPAPSPSSSSAQPTSSAAPAAVAQGCGEGQALLDSLSTRDKLAQLLMVGVTGTDDARAVVNDHHVGGIFIGSWTDLSIFDGPLKEITDAALPLPLAVSVDEEGGRVSRLSSRIGDQGAPRALVAGGMTPEQVYQLAFERGTAMKELGITVDFAPVVDVTDAPDDTVIGDRSFSSDPAEVTTYAGEYARGLRDAGLLPVLKHFPGHGRASGDSHTGGVTDPPLSQMQDSDLVPYRTLTTQRPVAVMVGHMVVPELTADRQASLSPEAYSLLRAGTGYNGPPFDGVVFTDDLSSMQAINDYYAVPDAVLMALQAGADVALWVTTDEVPAVLERLEAAVNSGELSLDAVDKSVLRLVAVKGTQARCGG